MLVQEEAAHFSNLYAPEHLIVNTEDAEDWLPMLDNAGSVFLGPYTPESVGDYASGTNHVLPTYASPQTLILFYWTCPVLPVSVGRCGDCTLLLCDPLLRDILHQCLGILRLRWHPVLCLRAGRQLWLLGVLARTQGWRLPVYALWQCRSGVSRL